jgi:heavy metal response regulator
MQPAVLTGEMKVLVVEDERKIASFVQKGLQEQGMVVDQAFDGKEGFFLATEKEYDVVILDIMLPGRDGLSVLRGLRSRKNNVPVIMLTARGELDERLEGLNLGADDYLTKPFYVEELVARIRTVVRRANGDTSSLVTVRDLTLNLITREVKRNGISIDLTMREFALLEFLMRSPGRVYTRIQICEHVWSYDFDPGTNLVDVYIRRIRKKIDAEFETKLIETIRGVGYRITEKGS